MYQRACRGLLTLFVLATPAWAGNIKADGQVISLEPTDPPLVVSSTAKVENLNADLLDGLSAADLVTQDQTGSVVRRAVFLADDTFVVPTGVTSLQVTVIGGGGGGGGGDIDLDGGGGGGSGLVVSTTVFVSEGDTLSADVGAGGVGGGGLEPGADGEPSILSSGLNSWRVEAAGSEGGGAGSSGFGGTGGSGLFGGGGGGGFFEGGNGGDGIFVDGEAGNLLIGGAGASGGEGGGSAGGGGGGGPGGGAAGGSAIPGFPGTQPGAGGGGGGEFASGGGHGAPGAIVIEWVGPPLDS